MSKPAMRPAAVANVLTKAGGIPISEALIALDIEKGAPTKEDGSINLIEYAAWLVNQISRRS